MFRECFFNAIKMEKNLGVGQGRPSRKSSASVFRLWAYMPRPILTATHYQASLLHIILQQPYQTQASSQML